jgi:hypothetical protein
VPKKRVFISHISEETDLAQALKRRLDIDFLGLLDIFVSSDQTSIEAGSKWLDEVDQALKSADLQMVLCSKKSVSRPWVNFEAGAAWLRGIPVIPVCHSDLKLIGLPAPFSMLQGIEASEPGGLKRLYGLIAKTIESNMPAVDFGAVAAEIRDTETKMMAASAGAERIENPRILCAASEQYAQPTLGFDLDVAVLEKTFPKSLTIERKLTRSRLRELLGGGQRFDIVHLVLAVDPATGDLIFSPIDEISHQPATEKIERMTPGGFADLLVESQTRLVVLATCNALLLAVEVAHVANMAATDVEITGEAAAEWEECFYGFLAQGKPLFKAFELTRSQVSTPIRPIRHKAVVFGKAKPGWP